MHGQSDTAGPHTFSATSYSATVAAGAAFLIVELALIRWLPGQIRVLGYFTNFVLLAAFLGLGVGMLAARRWPGLRALAWAAPLALVVVLGLAELGSLLEVLPTSDEVLFIEHRTRLTRIQLYPFLVLAFAIVAAGCAPLGHIVGRTLQGPRPLLRYALNIAGSLLGIGLFSVLSAVGAPPWSWMLLAGLASTIGLLDAPRRLRAVGLAIAVAISMLCAYATHGAIWSPYQKITTGPVHVHPQLGVVQEWHLKTLTAEQRKGLQELPARDGFTIRVNDDSYQTPIDLTPASVARWPALGPLQRQYDLPFHFRRPREVLVLGAGSGNDVAAALRAGATRVDAVDIDPVIIELGQRHPERPYADPRVHVHLDDGRSFLARTTRRWDMIVFGLLDSHVLGSGQSNVRLDSFVFTKQSFMLARQQLAPGGVLVVSHAVGTRWFFDRMRGTLAAAFGKPPQVLSNRIWHPIGIVYMAGDQLPPGEPLAAGDSPVLLEDDWPFVYLSGPGVPLQYLVAIALVLLASLFAVRATTGPRWSGLDAHFFALGAGFMLLETRALTQTALHLGSTWSVNAAVFAGVLLMALLSTLMAARLARRTAARSMPWAVYAALALLLVLSSAVPGALLSSWPFGLRVGSSILLASLPLLASGVLFSLGIARSGSADRALASNLLGAMVGGLFEYSSMLFGLQALVPIAAIFYLVALLADRRAHPPLPAAGSGASASATPFGHASNPTVNVTATD
jgi:hypothetical protein